MDNYVNTGKEKYTSSNTEYAATHKKINNFSMNNKANKKSIYRHTLEFLGVYVLSTFLVLFAHGYVPKEKERFYFSSLLITLVIFGAYESGRKNSGSNE